jgi:hypothetical protein
MRPGRRKVVIAGFNVVGCGGPIDHRFVSERLFGPRAVAKLNNEACRYAGSHRTLLRDAMTELMADI